MFVFAGTNSCLAMGAEGIFRVNQRGSVGSAPAMLLAQRFARAPWLVHQAQKGCALRSLETLLP